MTGPTESTHHLAVGTAAALELHGAAFGADEAGLNLPVLGTVPAPASVPSTISTRWIGWLRRAVR